MVGCCSEGVESVYEGVKSLRFSHTCIPCFTKFKKFKKFNLAGLSKQNKVVHKPHTQLNQLYLNQDKFAPIKFLRSVGLSNKKARSQMF